MNEILVAFRLGFVQYRCYALEACGLGSYKETLERVFSSGFPHAAPVPVSQQVLS